MRGHWRLIENPAALRKAAEDFFFGGFGEKRTLAETTRTKVKQKSSHEDEKRGRIGWGLVMK